MYIELVLAEGGKGEPSLLREHWHRSYESEGGNMC